MSGNIATICSLIREIEKLIKEENLSLGQIYNYDETVLYWNTPLKKTLPAVMRLLLLEGKE